MNKALVMIAAAFCAAVVPLLVNAGPLSVADWINVVLVGLGGVQVYIAKNLPEEPVWQYTKAIMAGITTAATLFVSMSGGITGSQVAQIIVTAVATFGVLMVPNPVTTSPEGKHEATA